MRSSHGHRAHCYRHALLPLLGSALVSQRSASQVPHASPTMRFAIEAKTASTVLTWGTTDVLVGADQIRGVYIGTVAQTAKLGRSCASGARYDPSAIQSWLPSADSLLRAAGPDSADSRPSIQTLFLPNRAGGGVMLGRLRKGARQWDPSPILYFMDAQGRGQPTEQGSLRLALGFLVALGRAGGASAVVEDGQDPRATFCDQYVQDSAAAAGVQPVELKGWPTLTMPDSLRAAGLDGLVLVRYVVLPGGRADILTADFEFASHPLLLGPVRQALADSRYEPARKDGVPIPSCVEQAFRFRAR